MHKITINRLYRQHAEVHINEIFTAIETHKNLVIKYRNELMEITWEDLAGKFKNYKTYDNEIKYYSFKFIPSFHLMEKI